MGQQKLMYYGVFYNWRILKLLGSTPSICQVILGLGSIAVM
jgi:hypothetical protein